MTKDGHPHEYHVEDQNCWSSSDYTALSLHPAWEGSGNENVPQRLGVMARRSAERTVVHLHLDQLEHPYAGTPAAQDRCLDMSLHLTPDEAERLARALIAKARLSCGTKRASPAF